MKKAISAATSAALLASLLATAVAPSAFAAITVGSAGNVPVGGTSANNVSFQFTEQLATSLTNAAGSFTVVLGPAGVTFSGTPSVAGSTGSLGASATVAGNTLSISFAGSDTANIESIFVTGLKLKAATGTPTGAISATITGFGGQFGSAGAVAAAFSAGGTASGYLATGVAIGAAVATVNVTTTGCPFVATTTAGAGSYAFAAGVAGTTAESLAGTQAAGGAGQQVLTITTAGGFTSAHNAGDVVTQTGACGGSVTLASPGTVVAALKYSSADNATVFPGEFNSPASNLTLVEPSAGFLAKDSTFTFKIVTPGVVFSTAPSVSTDSTTGTLSAPVLSADRLSATVTVKTVSVLPSTITLSGILYDVAATVASGTFISVEVSTSAGKAVQPVSNTNAVVFRAVVAASATSPTVYIGENNQTAGVVSFTESAAGFFTAGVGTGVNTFQICPSGVTYAFTLAPYAQVVGGVAAGNLILRDGSAASTTNIVQGTNLGNGCYGWTVWTASTTASTIKIGNAALAGGALINVTAAQAPGGVNVVLKIGSADFVNLTTAATVQFATAVYRNQVAVTALSQPFIAAGSNHAAGGNIQIAETGLGQLKFNEQICVEVLYRSGEYQDQFLNGLNTADLPVATASGTGLVISPVNAREKASCNSGIVNTPNGYMQSFWFTVLQQSTAGDGKIVISNISYTTLTGAIDGPVQLSVWGFGGSPTNVVFHSTVSNAIVGTAPAAAAVTTSGSALGATKTGPFTVSTKVAKLGKYVTWKFSAGSALVGQSVQIWVATKNSAGKWSAFAPLTARRVDTSGNAYFWWKTSSKAWISVRAGYLTTLSVATQARWL